MATARRVQPWRRSNRGAQRQQHQHSLQAAVQLGLRMAASSRPTPSPRGRTPFQLFQLGFIYGQTLHTVLAECGTQLSVEHRNVLWRLARCTNFQGQKQEDLKVLLRVMADVWRQMSPAQQLPFVQMAAKEERKCESLASAAQTTAEVMLPS